ncbi:hypothetical protein SAMN05518801_104250 [Novosphingobium sp. CF614]|uniref:hypothetical protein n=1 Tax=Novosphingobium sp. CF614 TaxID=1884364 RepID=UPI0008DFBEA0|nr:hypothetical protein [Novosphingobium sp. CF614]SFF97085.1 hypothetical protein SAMN05518801_104250 [Novosphingobium sp. CF614]
MMNAPRNSRASHAHDHADLRADNPLYDRAGSLRESFEAQRPDDNPERAARRESFMVKRQRPQPVLRPSPSLALGSDAAAFDAQWNDERRDAHNFDDSIALNERNQSMDDDRTDPPMERNAPRDVLRDGNLKASIWSNEGEKGPFYSATLARTWRDAEGQPHDTHSFAGSELLRVSELARKAYDRTQELRREDRQPAPPHEVQARQSAQTQASGPASAPNAPAPDQSREARREAFIEQRQQPQSAPIRQHDQNR